MYRCIFLKNIIFSKILSQNNINNNKKQTLSEATHNAVLDILKFNECIMALSIEKEQ